MGSNGVLKTVWHVRGQDLAQRKVCTALGTSCCTPQIFVGFHPPESKQQFMRAPSRITNLPQHTFKLVCMPQLSVVGWQPDAETCQCTPLHGKLNHLSLRTHTHTHTSTYLQSTYLHPNVAAGKQVGVRTTNWCLQASPHMQTLILETSQHPPSTPHDKARHKLKGGHPTFEDAGLFGPQVPPCIHWSLPKTDASEENQRRILFGKSRVVASINASHHLSTSRTSAGPGRCGPPSYKAWLGHKTQEHHDLDEKVSCCVM